MHFFLNELGGSVRRGRAHFNIKEVSDDTQNGITHMFAELLQPTHLLIIAAILVLFFGGRWFATLGIGFKEAIRNFRDASKAGPAKRISKG